MTAKTVVHRSPGERQGSMRLALAFVPFLLLAGLLAVILWSRPADTVRGAAVPPVERLTFQRLLDPAVRAIADPEALHASGPQRFEDGVQAVDDHEMANR